MRLASDNDFRWIGIGGTLIVIGILVWLFMLGERHETQQALNTKFGVASEHNAEMFAKDTQATRN